MNEINRLWEVQRLEGEEVKLAKQLKQIPEYQELKLLKKEIEDLQELVGQLKEQVLHEQKKLKKKENEIESMKSKLAQASSELYGGEIRNVKGLEAAEKNMAQIKQSISAAEDKLLELMGAVEERLAGLKNLTKRIAEMKMKFANLNNRYKSKREEISGFLEKTQKDKDILLNGISEELQQTYQTLRSKYPDGKPVALLRRGVCSGCNMSASFELLKLAKNKHEKLKCDNCGRLLIVE